MFLYFSIIFFIFSFIIIKLCSKYNVLIDDKSEKHKKLAQSMYRKPASDGGGGAGGLL